MLRRYEQSSLLPRYLHFVLGALAIAGMGLVVLGFRKQDITYRQWVIEQGSLLFTGATTVNFGVGFWFLATLPSVVRLNFIGGNGLATGLLGAGLLLPLAAICAPDYGQGQQISAAPTVDRRKLRRSDCGGDGRDARSAAESFPRALFQSRPTAGGVSVEHHRDFRRSVCGRTCNFVFHAP